MKVYDASLAIERDPARTPDVYRDAVEAAYAVFDRDAIGAVASVMPASRWAAVWLTPRDATRDVLFSLLRPKG